MARDDDRRLYVVPYASGWKVQSSSRKEQPKVFATRKEAEAAALKHLRIHGGELLVQEPRGRWRDSFTIGREAMHKINSVEGITLSSDMKRDLDKFDRSDLSADERRRAVARKYGRKRG